MPHPPRTAAPFTLTLDTTRDGHATLHVPDDSRSEALRTAAAVVAASDSAAFAPSSAAAQGLIAAALHSRSRSRTRPSSQLPLRSLHPPRFKDSERSLPHDPIHRRGHRGQANAAHSSGSDDDYEHEWKSRNRPSARRLISGGKIGENHVNSGGKSPDPSPRSIRRLALAALRGRGERLPEGAHAEYPSVAANHAASSALHGVEPVPVPPAALPGSGMTSTMRHHDRLSQTRSPTMEAAESQGTVLMSVGRMLSPRHGTVRGYEGGASISVSQQRPLSTRSNQSDSRTRRTFSFGAVYPMGGGQVPPSVATHSALSASVPLLSPAATAPTPSRPLPSSPSPKTHPMGSPQLNWSMDQWRAWANTDEEGRPIPPIDTNTATHQLSSANPPGQSAKLLDPATFFLSPTPTQRRRHRRAIRGGGDDESPSSSSSSSNQSPSPPRTGAPEAPTCEAASSLRHSVLAAPSSSSSSVTVPPASSLTNHPSIPHTAVPANMAEAASREGLPTNSKDSTDVGVADRDKGKSTLSVNHAGAPRSTLRDIAANALIRWHQRGYLRNVYDAWSGLTKHILKMKKADSFVWHRYKKNLTSFHFYSWLLLFRRRRKRCIEAFERWKNVTERGKASNQRVQKIWEPKGISLHRQSLLRRYLHGWLELSSYYDSEHDRAHDWYMQRLRARFWTSWLRASTRHMVARAFDGRNCMRRAWKAWKSVFDRAHRLHVFQSHHIERRQARLFYAWYSEWDSRAHWRSKVFEQWLHLFHARVHRRAALKRRVMQCWVNFRLQCQQQCGRADRLFDIHSKAKWRMENAWMVWRRKAEAIWEHRHFIVCQRRRMVKRWRSFVASTVQRRMMRLQSRSFRTLMSIGCWCQWVNDRQRDRWMVLTAARHASMRSFSHAIHQWKLFLNHVRLRRAQQALIHCLKLRRAVRTLHLHAVYGAYRNRMHRVGEEYRSRRLGGLTTIDWRTRGAAYGVGTVTGTASFPSLQPSSCAQNPAVNPSSVFEQLKQSLVKHSQIHVQLAQLDAATARRNARRTIPDPERTLPLGIRSSSVVSNAHRESQSELRTSDVASSGMEGERPPTVLSSLVTLSETIALSAFEHSSTSHASRSSASVHPLAATATSARSSNIGGRSINPMAGVSLSASDRFSLPLSAPDPHPIGSLPVSHLSDRTLPYPTPLTLTAMAKVGAAQRSNANSGDVGQLEALSSTDFTTLRTIPGSAFHHLPIKQTSRSLKKAVEGLPRHERPLPIPNDPELRGMRASVAGVSFIDTGATTGLSSSGRGMLMEGTSSNPIPHALWRIQARALEEARAEAADRTKRSGASASELMLHLPLPALELSNSIQAASVSSLSSSLPSLPTPSMGVPTSDTSPLVQADSSNAFMPSASMPYPNAANTSWNDAASTIAMAGSTFGFSNLTQPSITPSIQLQAMQRPDIQTNVFQQISMPLAAARVPTPPTHDPLQVMQQNAALPSNDESSAPVTPSNPNSLGHSSSTSPRQMTTPPSPFRSSLLSSMDAAMSAVQQLVDPSVSSGQALLRVLSPTRGTAFGGSGLPFSPASRRAHREALKQAIQKSHLSEQQIRKLAENEKMKRMNKDESDDRTKQSDGRLTLAELESGGNHADYSRKSTATDPPNLQGVLDHASESSTDLIEWELPDSNYRNEQLAKLHAQLSLLRRAFQSWHGVRGLKEKVGPFESFINSKLLWRSFHSWHERWLDQERWFTRRRMDRCFLPWWIATLSRMQQRNQRMVELLSLEESFLLPRLTRRLRHALDSWLYAWRTRLGERQRETRLQQLSAPLYSRVRARLARQVLPRYFHAWMNRFRSRSDLHQWIKPLLIDEAWKRTKVHRAFEYNRKVFQVLQRMMLQRTLRQWRQRAMLGRCMDRIVDRQRGWAFQRWRRHAQQLTAQLQREKQASQVVALVNYNVLSRAWSEWRFRCFHEDDLRWLDHAARHVSKLLARRSLHAIFKAWLSGMRSERRRRKEKANAEARESRMRAEALRVQLAVICRRHALLARFMKRWKMKLSEERERKWKEAQIELNAVPVFVGEDGQVIMHQHIPESSESHEASMPFPHSPMGTLFHSINIPPSTPAVASSPPRPISPPVARSANSLRGSGSSCVSSLLPSSLPSMASPPRPMQNLVAAPQPQATLRRQTAEATEMKAAAKQAEYQDRETTKQRLVDAPYQSESVPFNPSSNASGALHIDDLASSPRRTARPANQPLPHAHTSSQQQPSVPAPVAQHMTRDSEADRAAVTAPYDVADAYSAASQPHYDQRADVDAHTDGDIPRMMTQTMPAQMPQQAEPREHWQDQQQDGQHEELPKPTISVPIVPFPQTQASSTALPNATAASPRFVGFALSIPEETQLSPHHTSSSISYARRSPTQQGSSSLYDHALVRISPSPLSSTLTTTLHNIDADVHVPLRTLLSQAVPPPHSSASLMTSPLKRALEREREQQRLSRTDQFNAHAFSRSPPAKRRFHLIPDKLKTTDDDDALLPASAHASSKLPPTRRQNNKRRGFEESKESSVPMSMPMAGGRSPFRHTSASPPPNPQLSTSDSAGLSRPLPTKLRPARRVALP